MSTSNIYLAVFLGSKSNGMGAEVMPVVSPPRP